MIWNIGVSNMFLYHVDVNAHPIKYNRPGATNDDDTTYLPMTVSGDTYDLMLTNFMLLTSLFYKHVLLIKRFDNHIAIVFEPEFDRSKLPLFEGLFRFKSDDPYVALLDVVTDSFSSLSVVTHETMEDGLVVSTTTTYDSLEEMKSESKELIFTDEELKTLGRKAYECDALVLSFSSVVEEERVAEEPCNDLHVRMIGKVGPNWEYVDLYEQLRILSEQVESGDLAEFERLRSVVVAKSNALHRNVKIKRSGSKATAKKKKRRK